MAGIQPAARRLLTEATAAITYRTAAQVDTQADARIALQKAQPSGLASLGSDGKVPAGQLPPGATVFTAAKASTSFTSTTTTSPIADPELFITSLPIGIYELRGMLVTGLNSVSSGVGNLAGTGTTAVMSGSYTATYTNTATATPTLSGYLYNGALALPGNPGARLGLAGYLIVTTAGKLQLTLASVSAGSAFVLGPGSHIILTKVA